MVIGWKCLHGRELPVTEYIAEIHVIYSKLVMPKGDQTTTG